MPDERGFATEDEWNERTTRVLGGPGSGPQGGRKGSHSVHIHGSTPGGKAAEIVHSTNLTRKEATESANNLNNHLGDGSTAIVVGPKGNQKSTTSSTGRQVPERFTHVGKDPEESAGDGSSTASTGFHGFGHIFDK